MQRRARLMRVRAFGLAAGRKLCAKMHLSAFTRIWSVNAAGAANLARQLREAERELKAKQPHSEELRGRPCMILPSART
jgi:hypothetical protein